MRYIRFLFAMSAVFLLCSSVSMAQLIYQEGFNDPGDGTDGDGVRYTLGGPGGKGQLVGPDGPGAWEHSFNVDAIGLPSTATDKRAGILWANVPEEEDFTAESLQIWDNLIDYMMDGKAAANVGFLGDITSNTGAFLSLRLEDAGHSIVEIASGDPLPDPGDVDLVIHMEGADPASPTAFVSYPVPVITYNAQNHDDTLISSIGVPTTGGPSTITVVGEHPITAGLSGEIPWIDEFIEDAVLQGIGASVAGGADILATYIDPATNRELAALLVIEKDATLLGAFAPIPEGNGFIIGGDLNLDFGDGAASETDPKTLTLNPIDVSGKTGVKLSVDLAATTVDFEPPDLLRVLYAPDENAEFVTLADFQGDAGALVDAELGALNADEFTTFTFDIPDDATNLVVKFEAYSTFPNEVMGIDNVVVWGPDPISSCDPNTGGDLDGNGTVEFADFLVLSGNFGQAADSHAAGDIDCNGTVEFADFLVLSGNFGNTIVGAESVPEPSASLLALAGLLGIASLRRRR